MILFDNFIVFFVLGVYVGLRLPKVVGKVLLKLEDSLNIRDWEIDDSFATQVLINENNPVFVYYNESFGVYIQNLPYNTYTGYVTSSGDPNDIFQ